MDDASFPGPGDEGSDEALLVWNGVVARVPALVVRPASARELAATIRFARDRGLRVRIARGDAGRPPAERELTLDLAGLREGPVFPPARDGNRMGT
jgi:FAD/FMN-containing dehydrogenase